MSLVLIVDDEPDVCDSIGRVVERGGFEVISALDAEAGMQKCQSHDVDVVVTDIIMSGQDGVEFIQNLREAYPEIGIIAMSGGGNFAVAGYQPDAIKTAAYMAAAEAAGANCCLAKPFEQSELLDKLALLIA